MTAQCRVFLEHSTELYVLQVSLRCVCCPYADLKADHTNLAVSVADEKK